MANVLEVRKAYTESEWKSLLELAYKDSEPELPEILTEIGNAEQSNMIQLYHTSLVAEMYSYCCWILILMFRTRIESLYHRDVSIAEIQSKFGSRPLKELKPATAFVLDSCEYVPNVIVTSNVASYLKTGGQLTLAGLDGTLDTTLHLFTLRSLGLDPAKKNAQSLAMLDYVSGFTENLERMNLNTQIQKILYAAYVWLILTHIGLPDGRQLPEEIGISIETALGAVSGMYQIVQKYPMVESLYEGNYEALSGFTDKLSVFGYSSTLGRLLQSGYSL